MATSIRYPFCSTFFYTSSVQCGVAWNLSRVFAWLLVFAIAAVTQAKPPAAKPDNGPTKTWHDAEGKLLDTGTFESFSNESGIVRIRKSDDSTVALQFDALSVSDRAAVLTHDKKHSEFQRPSRGWASADGKYRVVAKAITIDDKTVRLARAGEKEKIVSVPLDKLSKADRSYLDRLQKVDNSAAKRSTKGRVTVEAQPDASPESKSKTTTGRPPHANGTAFISDVLAAGAAPITDEVINRHSDLSDPEVKSRIQRNTSEKGDIVSRARDISPISDEECIEILKRSCVKMKKGSEASRRFAALETWPIADGIRIGIGIDENGIVQTWFMASKGAEALEVVFERPVTSEGSSHELPRDHDTTPVNAYPILLTNLRGVAQMYDLAFVPATAFKTGGDTIPIPDGNRLQIAKISRAIFHLLGHRDVGRRIVLDVPEWP